MIKTPLTELIERLEEKIKICSSTNLEREAMGMLEAKAIATELLEKEREQIEVAYYRGKSDTQNPEQMSAEKTLLEKAFNDARKQISMLGEKEVQMTDYLIQPKYKTFEDWYNKQSKQEEVNHVKDFHTLNQNK